MAKRRPPNDHDRRGPAVDGHADPKEVYQAVQDTPTKYLQCRVMLRHAWRELGMYETEDGYIEHRCKCTRCGTEKHTTYSQSGRPLGSQYVYPDGFSLKGLGLMNADANDAQRVAIFHRVTSGRG